MSALIAGLAGLVFGMGLLLSGMADPAKVLGFLDLAGPWDPSLALVMGGAIAVAAPAFAWVHRRGRTLRDTPLHTPAQRKLDVRLIGGSLAFGAGWGIGGFCPGPALVGMAAGNAGALLFVAAMVVGMAAFSFVERAKTPSLKLSGER